MSAVLASKMMTLRRNSATILDMMGQGSNMQKNINLQPKAGELISSCDDTVVSCTSHEEKRKDDRSERMIDVLLQEKKWKRVEKLIKQEPNQVMTIIKLAPESGMSQALPIHVLCSEDNVPNSLIEAALMANPKTIQEPEKETGMLPLHFACNKSNVSQKILLELVKLYPDAAKTQDKKGCLPLHYAAAFSSDPQTLELLLKVYPAGVWVQDLAGDLPLHRVCARSRVDNSMVRVLIKAQPQCTKVKNNAGRLPLHLACLWHNPTFVIAALLHEYPESASMLDMDSKSPQDLLSTRASDYSACSDPRFQVLRSALANLNGKHLTKVPQQSEPGRKISSKLRKLKSLVSGV